MSSLLNNINKAEGDIKTYNLRYIFSHKIIPALQKVTPTFIKLFLEINVFSMKLYKLVRKET